jgi:probable phosphoglycerate mutase
MQLIFVRHGKPKVVEDENDPVLSDVGRAQAERLADWLAQRGIERVVSSPLRRAMSTAEPTSRILGLELEVVDGLAEVGRGGPGYRGVEQLRKDPVRWANFLDDPVSFFGGDPVAFRETVLSSVAGLFNGHDAGRTAVFTHGVPINVVISHALGLKRVMHFLPDYCSLTRAAGSSLTDLTIESINETGHLGDWDQARQEKSNANIQHR